MTTFKKLVEEKIAANPELRQAVEEDRRQCEEERLTANPAAKTPSGSPAPSRPEV